MGKKGKAMKIGGFRVIADQDGAVKRMPTDLPPIERCQHQGGVEIRGGRAYTLEWYPDFLLSRKAITQGQHEAIKRLYHDWYAAGLSPITAIPLEWMPPSTGDTMAEHQARKLKAYLRASRELTDEWRDVVQYTCLYEQGTLDAFDKHIHKREGTARARLIGALTKLCVYYHIRPYG